MPKIPGGGQQGNILPWTVLLIWGVASLTAAGILLAALAGFVNPESLLAPLQAVPEVPTVPALPTPGQGLEGSPAGQTTATKPPEPAGTALPPGQGGGGDPVGGGYFEPTFTPLFPVSPTPTFFLTQPAPWEGPLEIGTSAEGRPLEVYRFGSGPVKRLIVAGIHGGYEWNTVALADELIEHLKKQPNFVPRTVTLYILRAMNPDGLARARGVDGRANENNVDLNRNFPINWQVDWPRDGCWSYLRISGGEGPGSEPETQAVMDFILQVRPTAIISYHSAALGIFPGGEPWQAESLDLARTLSEVSRYPFPPIDTGCLYTGTLPDFAVEHGIPAVDLELHTHEFTDFQENLEVLRAFLEWRK